VQREVRKTVRWFIRRREARSQESRWLVACRPREQQSAGGCSGGDGATAAAVAGKGEPKGRRTTWKVLAHTVGLEGARGGGNAAVASLASRPWRPCSSTRTQVL
jgi:hypothetical protein